MLELNLHPFTPLETERLLLRQFTLDDAHDLFILRKDKQVMQHIDRPLAQSLQDSIDLIEKVNGAFDNNEGITWGITLKENPQNVIGTIGYWRINKEHHRAEVGYLLHPGFQRKGIMHEAITAVIRYGFDQMKIHSIEANVSPDNEASFKVLERTNFVREGYFKENYYSKGKFLDSVIYSLVNFSDL
jgi:ribosomal-protein-alanine N-acetyltransferase